VKTYLYLGFGVVAVLALIYSHRGAYNYGRLAERDEVRRALAVHQEREAKLVEALEAERQKVRVQYRERVRIVREAPDPIVCADQKLPPALLESLRKDQP
jgi:hypothetical protein